MPPATATVTSPVATACAASITAFRPEPQTLLMVMAATRGSRPPRSAAWRAGAWPSPALTTFPMMHSSTAAGSMAARRTASATTRAPRSVAENPLRAPRNLPVGVRTALTMTASRTSRVLKDDTRSYGIRSDQLADALENDRAGADDFEAPRLCSGAYLEAPIVGPRDGRGARECGSGGDPPC